MLSFGDITVLEEAGLVNSNDFSYNFEIIPVTDELYYSQSSCLFYGDLVLCLKSLDKMSTIREKVTFLTQSGVEILKLVTIQSNKDYLEFIGQKFNKYPSIKVVLSSNFTIKEDEIKLEEKTYIN